MPIINNSKHYIFFMRADFQNLQKLVPESFLLVPGVGAQGGSLEEVYRHGANKTVGLLVNSSRGILYAGNGEDFAEAALGAANRLQQEMEKLLS